MARIWPKGIKVGLRQRRQLTQLRSGDGPPSRGASALAPAAPGAACAGRYRPSGQVSHATADSIEYWLTDTLPIMLPQWCALRHFAKRLDVVVWTLEAVEAKQ